MTSQQNEPLGPATVRARARAPLHRGERTAIAYVRVSMAREDMVSPDIQERQIRAWAGHNAATIVDVVSDLDLSGRGFAKRQVRSIIDRIRDGQADAVLVYNFSRFGRNAAVSLAHIAEVEQVGGTVISATEPVDPETAIGRFTRTTALAVAELQSDQISDSWKAAMARRVSLGLPGNGQPRFGYVYHRATTEHRRCTQGCDIGACSTGYVPDPVTGPILTSLYQDYLSGTGLPMLAEGLNLQGIPGTRGGTWTTTTVRCMLDNGFAAGLIVHRGQWHHGIHEPLIDEKTWAAYRSRRERLRAVPTRMRAPVHSTAGLAICGYCGSSMIAASSRKNGQSYILRCSSMQSRGLSECAGVQIVRHAVEAAVKDWLRPYADRIDEIAVAAHEHMAKTEPDRTAKVHDDHAKALVQLRARLDRLTDALELGSLPTTEYTPRRKKIEDEIADVEARADTVVPERQQVEPARVARLLDDWDELDPATIRDILGALIERIECLPRGQDPRVRVWARFTVD